MQTTTASGTRFTLPTHSETSHSIQDILTDSQTEATNFAEAGQHVCPSPIQSPSPPAQANPDKLAHFLTDVPTDSSSKTEPVSSDNSFSRNDVLDAGMSAAQETFEDKPEIALPTQLPDPAVATPSVDLDPLPYSEYVAPVEEHKDNEDTEAILRELAPYRMAVMDLRSVAQQQGKGLRGLQQQFINDTSAIVNALKHSTTHTADANTPSLVDQVAALSTLQGEIEETRKLFHNSQELLLRKEWKLKEEEDRLYTRYMGGQAASILSNDLSDDYSDQPSVSPSISLDEQTVAPEGLSPSAVLTQNETNVEDDGTGFPTQAEDRFMEVLTPPPTLLSLDVVALADLPDNSKAIRESSVGAYIGQLIPSVRNLANSGLSSPRMGERLRKSSRALDPKDAVFNYLGSQFDNESQTQFPIAPDRSRQIVLSPDASFSSDYSLPRLSRWFAFGVPWSHFTRGRRHRPYRLPEGVSAWQAMAINHYVAAALGLPISGRLDLAKDPESTQLGATRRSLLQSWFWDPKDRSNHSSSSILALSEADYMPSMRYSPVTSMKKTPVAATAPYLGGSPSSTLRLEDGGISNGIVEHKPRFTPDPYTALSDKGISRHPSKGKKPA